MLPSPMLPSPVAIELGIASAPAEVLAGEAFRIRVRLANRSAFDLKSCGPNPVHLAYHCYAENGECVVYDGRRSRLHVLKPGIAAEVEMDLEAAPVAGWFRFRLTLVQEGVRWFDDAPQKLFADQWIRVVGR